MEYLLPTSVLLVVLFVGFGVLYYAINHNPRAYKFGVLIVVTDSVMIFFYGMQLSNYTII